MIFSVTTYAGRYWLDHAQIDDVQYCPKLTLPWSAFLTPPNHESGYMYPTICNPTDLSSS